jgi:hypothetical protein
MHTPMLQPARSLLGFCRAQRCCNKTPNSPDPWRRACSWLSQGEPTGHCSPGAHHDIQDMPLDPAQPPLCCTTQQRQTEVKKKV